MLQFWFTVLGFQGFVNCWLVDQLSQRDQKLTRNVAGQHVLPDANNPAVITFVFQVYATTTAATTYQCKGFEGRYSLVSLVRNLN